MQNSQVGLIGLAVMGQNFARNLASKGIKTVVYNRTVKTTEDFIKQHGGPNLTSAKTLEELAQNLEKPRIIMMLVQAGEAIDEVLKALTPLLDKNDLIVDLGNSHFKDTEKRAAKLAKKGLHFWGCGISGGERGALNGPSLMPGGPGGSADTKASWKTLQPILEAVAAKDFKNKPCVTYLGPAPAGHYIKMVHNGIEYGIIKIIAEAFQMLNKLFMMPTGDIAKIFKSYNQGKLKSYLFELATVVVSTKDRLAEGFLVDNILDKAEQKSTGAWTVSEAIEKNVAIPTIAEAVFARFISSEKEKRVKLDQIFQRKHQKENLSLDKFINMLDDALFAATISIYGQGMELIRTASQHYKWGIDLAEVIRIWQGGCIIRAQLLELIEKEYRASENKNVHLFELPQITANLEVNAPNLAKTVTEGAENFIAIPGLSSALAYFVDITEGTGDSNLIQALRDAFGAHTYERVDRKGSFHTEWLK